MFMQRRYFFDQGIRFKCRRCGICCTGAPGTIYVSAEEIRIIANHLGLSKAQLHVRYLYPFKDSFSIREDEQGNCLFFEGISNHGCAIYPVRPLQCRSFPFWFSNMRSERRWQEIASQCPGIGEGRVYGRDEILSIVQLTMKI